MSSGAFRAALDKLRGESPTVLPGLGTVRAMRSADVPAVAAIEALAYPYPWSADVFRDCLRAGYLCRVLEHDGVLVGYGVMSTVLDEAHLLNVCVDPRQQGTGRGRALVLHLLEQAARGKAHAMYLEVRPSNRAARALYASLEFVQVGLRKGYYPDPGGREDALILVRDLD